MLKYAILAIATTNAALTPREETTVKITKRRFLGGLGEFTYQEPSNAAVKTFSDIGECITDLEAILADAEAFFADIKKEDPASILAMMKALEVLLDLLHLLTNKGMIKSIDCHENSNCSTCAILATV